MIPPSRPCLPKTQTCRRLPTSSSICHSFHDFGKGFVGHVGGPAAAHAYLFKGLRLSAKDLSRRDSLKVAQYEVLGNDAKRRVRPARDDRNVRSLVSHAAQRFPALVDNPSGKDSYLRGLTQHFVLGSFVRSLRD